MTTLSDRILDCFPAGVYALHGLLRLLDIVETRSVPTAAVECTAQPRLLVNPDFVGRHAATPEKLLMLVMHELYHVLLGHCRLFPRATAADNLVFDAVINALLCRMFPQPEHTCLFTDYYPDDCFPACLLRPSAGWRPDQPCPLPPVLAHPDLAEVAEVYRALYSPTGATYDELYGVLGRLVSETLAAGVALLGDHRGEGRDSDDAASSAGALEERSPMLFDIVRQIVERWPQPPDPIRGRSLADLLKAESLQVRHHPGNRVVLRRLLRKLAACDGEAGIRRELRDDERPILTPLPVFDRRATVLRALGAPPLLYTGSLAEPRRLPGGERVHVYVDVSGSIGDLKAALYGAVLDCRELVHPAIHLFSTRVADVTLTQLRKGVCRTTHGTCISCVAAHVREHAVRRAVLLTDGFVGAPAGGDRDTLRRVKLGVALVPGNISRDDLREVVDHWEQLG
jgi:hypothetical protein